MRVLGAGADAAGEVRDDVEDHRRLEVDAGVAQARSEAPPIAGQGLVLPRPDAFARRLRIALKRLGPLGLLRGRLVALGADPLERAGMLRAVDVMRRRVGILRPRVDAALGRRGRRRIARWRILRERHALAHRVLAREHRDAQQRDGRDRRCDARSLGPARLQMRMSSPHFRRLPRRPRGGATPPSARAIDVALWSIMPT